MRVLHVPGFWEPRLLLGAPNAFDSL
jgi:hypothetical protein